MPTAWIIGLVVGALVILGIIIQVVRRPLAVVSYLLKNLLIGCVGLLVVDYLGKSINLHVPLNIGTASVAGILGLPGIAALAVIEKWIL